MTDQQQQNSSNNNDAPEQQTQAESQLSLQDLQGAVQVIDLCSQRGAFQGSELEAVGALRGRLRDFISANTTTPEDPSEGESE